MIYLYDLQFSMTPSLGWVEPFACILHSLLEITNPNVLVFLQTLLKWPTRRSLDEMDQAPGKPIGIIRSEEPRQRPRLVVGYRWRDPAQQALVLSDRFWIGRFLRRQWPQLDQTTDFGTHSGPPAVVGKLGTFSLPASVRGCFNSCAKTGKGSRGLYMVITILPKLALDSM